MPSKKAAAFDEATGDSKKSSFLSFNSVLLMICLAVFMLADCDLTLYLLSSIPVKMPADSSMQGQVVWIVGASSGIGAALASDLLETGKVATVVLSARRKDELEKVAAGLQIGSTYILPLDVTDHVASQTAYDEIIAKYGKIDSLVLNAGRSQRAGALKTKLSDTRDLFDLNFFSFVNIAKIVVPKMVSDGKGGQVVVVSSVAGKFGNPTASSYSATKFAQHGYFDALRAEVGGQHNINVLLVCPGPVESEITKHVIRNDGKEGIDEKDKKMETSRCSYLMTKAMQWRLDEVWIAQQPFLFITYLFEYLPGVSRQLMKNVVGPSRVKTLKSGGEKMYDIKQLFGFGIPENKKA